MAAQIKSFLVFETGSLAGKKYQLKKTEFTLGTDRRCTVRLAGEFVSPLHSELRLRDEGQWLIQNRSPNQTLVNEKIIDARPLVHGDLIQIGSDNLARFEVVDPSKKKKATKVAGEDSDLVALIKRPAVAVGLTLYIGLMVVIFSLLGGRSGDAEGESEWSIAKLNPAFDSTYKKLIKPPSNVIAEKSEISAKIELTEYEELLNLHRKKGVSAEEISDQAGYLLDGVSGAIKDIWHLEQQERWAEAKQGYTELIDRLPDPSLAVTRKLIERKNWVSNQERIQRRRR